MYHAEPIDISRDHIMSAYCDESALRANNMKNTSNFYIRNLMTGLKKKPEERTPNENDVIRAVSEAVPEINAALEAKHEAKVRKIEADRRLSDEQKEQKIAALKLRHHEMPTAENWFAGDQLLDSVFRHTENPDYTAFHSHVMQNAVKDVAESWMSFFRSRKAYAPDSGHTGRPRIPGYLPSGGRSAAVFSNLACSVRRGLLSFPKMKAKPDGEKTPDSPCGKIFRLDVSKLPHASKDKLIEVRIVPYQGIYRIWIITDDGVPEEDVLPKEEDVIGEDGTPAGVMMIDLGLTNLAAISDNRGGTPIVIKGGAVKSANQWFNKQMAFLRSEQMKGHDPKEYHPETTKRMHAVSRKRDAFIRDAFYKYAHFICRLMKERGLSYLIIGHNRGQKNGVRLGHETDQAFVSIPFMKLIQALMSVSRRYGVRVIMQEESYTSQACFSARDFIPTYGKNDAGVHEFSGRRIRRGLYLQNDGVIMNADVNGSANIGRKRDERIFPEGMDFSYLHSEVKAMTHRDVMNESRAWHKRNKGIAGHAA